MLNTFFNVCKKRLHPFWAHRKPLAMLCNQIFQTGSRKTTAV